MEATEAWALEKGLTDVRLHVLAFNAEARAFYEQLGYLVVSLRLHKTLGVPAKGRREPGA